MSAKLKFNNFSNVTDSSFEEDRRESMDVSNLVDYSIKTADKPVKGKIDIKTLMPKIPKHIQVYIAVAFSEKDFSSYSKIFNKTLSSIPNSFLISDSLSRRYNISLSPLFFVLPNSGRFSSSIYEVMCSSLDKKRVVAILVIGESPAAFTVSLTAITSNIPVLWARGGTPNPPGNLQQENLLEIRLEPNEFQLLEAIRGIFLATHWHSFTVMASPSLAARCASILDLAPLNPKVVTISRNPHNIFRKLADVSRSTRGVVLLLCDLTDAIMVMNMAKKLSMMDGHFVWIWIDTTTKPASFLSLPDSSIRVNRTQKHAKYLKKTPGPRIKKDELKAKSRSVVERTSQKVAEKKREEEYSNKSDQLKNVPNKKSLNKIVEKPRNRRHVTDLGETLNTLMATDKDDSIVTFFSRNDVQSKKNKKGRSFTEKKDAEDFSAPVSKTWGKITEYFPSRPFGPRLTNDDFLGSRALPVGLLSVKPEPIKLDRHLLKGSVRLLVSTFHSVLKKSADWLSVLDSDSSCWTKPSSMNKNFSETYAREIRQAVGNSLSGQTQFQEGDRADRSLLANFQILNLVPEKFQVSFNNNDNVIEDAVLYWRQVGKVLGRNAHLNTIVWPGGDLVASALSARTRSVFRVVTALAPPFVMEGSLDEDGQCLRGIICHRVLNSDKDNLTLVFSEMETQERMEDEVEELGVNERIEKPFKFIDHNYFEYHSTKYSYKSSCCYGLAMDLLENVAQELEFEFHLYIIPDGAYGAKSHVWEQGTPRSKWNGIVGDLVSGAAHMSFAALSVSKQRSQVIDFSTPYFFSGVSFLAAPTQKSEVPLLAFLLPFSTELWIAIFTSLNITAMAVACYEWLSPFGLNPWGRQRSRNFSIASALWVMWGLLCGHLVAFKAPKSWPNKFLINVWGGFSVIFVASYTANIAALIAGLFFHNSVSDYHDRSLLTQRVGAPRSSSADYYIHRANQHLWEHMQKYSFDDVETGISLLRNGSLDILVADTPILDYYRATDHGCKLQKIVEAINEDTYAIGMNKGFPLKESISAVISKYSNNGYMDILTEKWYGGLPCFKMSPSVKLTDVTQPRPLGVAAVAGVFLLLVLGMVFGILILVLEHLFYRYTLPILRHQPKGTIWRSRNVMFFSQKLYRFINCVELVSPHHAARELVHTLRQGQITSLFQKSVKRKEHEQRRRRKSKAQFFEMIQEIRRVQKEEKEEPKIIQNISGTNVISSPKIQLGGFLSSPRSLKRFRSSKSSVSPEKRPVDVTGHLIPSEFRKPFKSPSRLDLRQLSKELFSLPRSPKSPKIKSSESSGLENRRPSLNVEEIKTNDFKNYKTSEIRLSAKDIRIQTSKAVGRRLSKDTSSSFISSPPDGNSRRKSHQEIGSKNVKLALGKSSEIENFKNIRPRLPSPPKSPVFADNQSRLPKVGAKIANEQNFHDTAITRKENQIKKTGVKNSHCRSKSLDNKHFGFDTSWTKVNITSDEENFLKKKQTVSYAILEHKRGEGEGEGESEKEEKIKLNANFQSNGNIAKDLKVMKIKEPGVGQKFYGAKFSNKKPEIAPDTETTKISVSVDDLCPIYAKPQKSRKDRKEEESTNSSIINNNRKLKTFQKSGFSNAKESRVCTESDTNVFPILAIASSAPNCEIANMKMKQFAEYDYYSECKRFRKSHSLSDQGEGIHFVDSQSAVKKNRLTTSPNRQRSTERKPKLQAQSRRSRSVPEQRVASGCDESEIFSANFENRQLKHETAISVFRPSTSHSRNSMAFNNRNRSREELDLTPIPSTPKGRARRQSPKERNAVPSLRKQISEPP